MFGEAEPALFVMLCNVFEVCVAMPLIPTTRPSRNVGCWQITPDRPRKECLSDCVILTAWPIGKFVLVSLGGTLALALIAPTSGSMTADIIANKLFFILIRLLEKYSLKITPTSCVELQNTACNQTLTENDFFHSINTVQFETLVSL